MERTIVKPYIEENGDPDDWMALCKHKDGHLGTRLSIWPDRLEDGRIAYTFQLHVDKHKFGRWVKENEFLFEGFVTFRIGPVIVAHPGRDHSDWDMGNKSKQKSIKAWDAEFGMLGETETHWFNLLQGPILVSAVRGKTGGWEVERVK